MYEDLIPVLEADDIKHCVSYLLGCSNPIAEYFAEKLSHAWRTKGLNLWYDKGNNLYISDTPYIEEAKLTSVTRLMARATT